MSEERPRLRLKPRLTPDSADAAALPTAPTSPLPATMAATPDTVAPAGPAIGQAAPSPSVSAVGVQLEAQGPAELPVGTGSSAPDAPRGVAAQSVRRVKLAALSIGVAGMVVFSIVAIVAIPKLISAAKQESVGLTLEEQADASEQEPTAAVVATEQTPGPAAAKGASGVSERLDAVAQTSPLPPADGASAQAGLAAEGAADAWIKQIRISGVRAGASPRVLLGGRSYAPGDVVNVELGLSFDSYDAARRVLRFRDATGRIIARPDR